MADILLGLYKAGSVTYVGLVTHSIPCGEDFPNTLKVDEVKFLAVHGYEKGHRLSSSDQKELDLLYSSFGRHDFYFSMNPRTYDVTRTVQGNDQLSSFYRSTDGSKSIFPSTFKDCDNRFYWNYVALQTIVKAISLQEHIELERETSLNTWITPVTSAAVSSFAFDMNNTTYSISLVSRRSRSRQGPRLRTRGIDSYGNVANFVETEQILRSRDINDNDMVASFVQIRGSLPLFWEQADRFMPKPAITLRHEQVSEHGAAMATHLQDLQLNYVSRFENDTCHMTSADINVENYTPSIVLLNLVDKCASQGDIGRYMIQVLDTLASKSDDESTDENSLHNRSHVTLSDYRFLFNSTYRSPISPSGEYLCNESLHNNSGSNLRLVWYDFHHHHQGSTLTSAPRSSKVLAGIQDVLMSNSTFFLKFFNKSAIADEVDSTNKPLSSFNTRSYVQSRIIRTNCVDSLDRTNVAQVYFYRVFCHLHSIVLLSEP